MNHQGDRRIRITFFFIPYMPIKISVEKVSHGIQREHSKEVKSDDLFFMNWVIYLSILSFHIYFFIC